MPRISAFLIVLAVAAGVIAAPSSAVVPPRDCKTITIGSKRYQVKADKISCSAAKDYMRTYMRSGVKPRSYTCRRYSSGLMLRRCDNTKASPDRVIFVFKARS